MFSRDSHFSRRGLRLRTGGPPSRRPTSLQSGARLLEGVSGRVPRSRPSGCRMLAACQLDPGVISASPMSRQEGDTKYRLLRSPARRARPSSSSTVRDSCRSRGARPVSTSAGAACRLCARSKGPVDEANAAPSVCRMPCGPRLQRLPVRFGFRALRHRPAPRRPRWSGEVYQAKDAKLRLSCLTRAVPLIAASVRESNVGKSSRNLCSRRIARAADSPPKKIKHFQILAEGDETATRTPAMADDAVSGRLEQSTRRNSLLDATRLAQNPNTSMMMACSPASTEGRQPGRKSIACSRRSRALAKDETVGCSYTFIRTVAWSEAFEQDALTRRLDRRARRQRCRRRSSI